MVSSNLGGDNAQVHNVLNSDETEWLAGEGRTDKQGFVLRTRGCERKITGVRIQNAAPPHASKKVRISWSLAHKQPWWNTLVEEELDESVGTATFHFSQFVFARLIRFELLNSYNGRGGLRSVSLTTGTFVG